MGLSSNNEAIQHVFCWVKIPPSCTSPRHSKYKVKTIGQVKNISYRLSGGSLYGSREMIQSMPRQDVVEGASPLGHRSGNGSQSVPSEPRRNLKRGLWLVNVFASIRSELKTPRDVWKKNINCRINSNCSHLERWILSKPCRVTWIIQLFINIHVANFHTFSPKLGKSRW